MTDIIKFKLNTNDIMILAYILIQVIFLIVYKGLSYTFLPVIYLASASLILLSALIKPQSKPSFFHFVKHIMPLMLIYVFYRIIDVQINLLNFKIHDSLFYNLERNILGMYPSFALQRVMEVWLNETSFALYFFGIGLFFWAIIKFYRKQHIEIFENFIFAIILGSLLCLTVISIFPVMGPGKALEEYYYLGLYGPRFSLVIPFLLKIFTPSVGSFPSIYFCLLTVSSYYLWDYGKSYVIVSFVALTAVFWGGIYLRYHYLVDALAALLIAFLASTVAGFVFYLKYGRSLEESRSHPAGN